MNFRRVVIGMDFSARSLAAARWTARNLSTDAELIFTHVLPEPETPSFLRARVSSLLDVITDMAPALSAGLLGVAELIAPGRSRIEIVAGDPADGLARVADAVGADLICLGRRRSRRGGARFGATTAHRLLARTRIPVLIIPGTGESTPRRVLAALDDGVASERVATVAGALAARWEAHVHALHVLSPRLRDLVRACRHLDNVDAPDASAESVRDVNDLFCITRRWVEQRARSANVASELLRPSVSVGDPGQEILALAHATPVDLVVLGRGGAPDRARRAGRVEPLGSTMRYVMWAAPCPVLIVSPPRARASVSPMPRSFPIRVGSPGLSVPRRVLSSERDPLPPAAGRPLAVCDCCPGPVSIPVGA
jgi:nucleotide-binding universal stress UspA family protein